MPLKVQCSAGHLMMVPDHRAGTTLRCPRCGIDVEIPGEAVAKQLGKPKLQPPAIPKPMLSTPAISGAGEQSPQVAGRAPVMKSALSKPANQLLKPRVKAPPMVKRDATVEEPPKAAETRPSEISSVVEAPQVIPPQVVAPPVVTTETADLVFGEVQPLESKRPTKPEPRVEPKVETPTTKQTSVDPRSKPTSNRPRATLTGTILSPSTPDLEIPTPESTPKQKPPSSPRTAPKVDTLPIEPTVSPTPPVVAAPIVSDPVAPPPVEEPPVVVAGVRPAPAKPPTEVALSFHAAATQVEESLPHPPAPPIVLTLGPRPTASQRMAVWQLAAALLAAMLLSIGPSLWEIGDYLNSDGEYSVASWAYFLLVLGMVQLGTLLILVQVPDWSSVWIVTMQSLALAALYAAILGLTVITSGDSTLIGALSLDHQYATGKAPMWCVCLAATYSCLALFAGKFSAKWRKVLQQMRATDEAAYAH